MDMKLTLVLHNIRSTYNVGAILRTAEGLGVERVIFSGYTPRYDDPTLLPHLREKLNHQIAKSALGAEEMVRRENVDDLATWLENERDNGALILGLENNLAPTEEAQRVELGSEKMRELLSGQKKEVSDASFDDDGAKINNERKAILILGEEVAGIPAEIRTACEYFLEIPMYGRKESFNVSVAAAIAMWEILRDAGLTSS